MWSANMISLTWYLWHAISDIVGGVTCMQLSLKATAACHRVTCLVTSCHVTCTCFIHIKSHVISLTWYFWHGISDYDNHWHDIFDMISLTCFLQRYISDIVITLTWWSDPSQIRPIRRMIKSEPNQEHILLDRLSLWATTYQREQMYRVGWAKEITERIQVKVNSDHESDRCQRHGCSCFRSCYISVNRHSRALMTWYITWLLMWMHVTFDVNETRCMSHNMTSPGT